MLSTTNQASRPTDDLGRQYSSAHDSALPLTGDDLIDSTWFKTDVHFRYSLSDYRLFSVGVSGYAFTVPLIALLPASFRFDINALLMTAPPAAAMLCVRDFPLDYLQPRLAFKDDKIVYVLNQSYRYYVHLCGTFDSYLASLSGKSRSTLKRKVKKFAATTNGTVDWRVFTAPNEMAHYHALARTVATKTYQDRLFSGALPDNAHFRQELLSLAARHTIRGYILFADKVPISYLHIPIRDGVAEYAYLGYDPSYASYSPGTVLLYYALQDLFSHSGIIYFDFSYGAGQTKEVFATSKYLRADVVYLSRSYRHYATTYTHLGSERLSQFLGRALDRVNLRGTVKRILRQGENI